MNNKKFNVLLTGHTGFYNRGCEAIVRGTIKSISKALPNCTFSLCSSDYKNDKIYANKHSIDIDKIYMDPYADKSLRRLWTVNFSKHILRRRIDYPRYITKKLINKHDIIVSIGGDNLTLDYGNPNRFFNTIEIAQIKKKPTIIWAASIGPFEPTDAETRRWIDILKKVNLITIREDTSRGYLNQYGITENVLEITDPAFLLEPQEKSFLEINDKFLRKCIGINPNSLFTKFQDHYSIYYDCTIKLIRYIIEDGKTNVLLVPHVLGDRQTRNDYSVCKQIQSDIDSPMLKTTPPDLNARQLKYLISKCKVFVGGRTHSTIASLSSCIPTLSIAYSPKATGINLQMFGHSNYIIHMKDLNEELLIESFKQITREAQVISDALKNKLPELKSKALIPTKVLESLVR